MPLPAFILWNGDPEVLSTFGLHLGRDLRWYGLLFAAGFVIGQIIISHIYKAEGKPARDVDTITYYMVIATVIGARLGHCLFYEPEYFLVHPIEILKIWKGGLASHGATVGIILAIYLYSRNRPGQSFFWTIDRIVITIGLAGAFIRLGNFTNSEIVGKPTDASYGVIFARSGYDLLQRQVPQAQDIELHQTGQTVTYEGQTLPIVNVSFQTSAANTGKEGLERAIKNMVAPMLNASPEQVEAAGYLHVDYSKLNVQVVDTGNGVLKTSFNVLGVPRLPSQLFEAFSTFLLFVLLYVIWNRYKAATPEGLLFGIFCLVLFSLRIVYEFNKEPQVDFERNMDLNMGQLLSIPMVLVGIITLLIVNRRQKQKQESNVKR